ncbi:hypothetical protein MCOR28_010004 [Pyricularia oryzae]|uniref:Geranylgeranyl pyrophosphate synthetase n=1 Tax=Pyricularia oryzae TaxID=318829 RepID=A0A4P7NMN9_PYROR|nr:hypothetical protein MCOR26_010154 [Pyricularia oryzae]KAI6301348.1 hypothetical protein MCOR34_008999 [Pyricularia oryzae]KAI6334633.1 hypothetical protein MCOR28_010004 [Pyricularia oryzae]KAI6456965.1 hypothetical protein MCOR17_008038 [Pyricularia oryzae]KAI6573457.1 hypothetical protein MCOR04_007371 [Pyricularia oryzae]
MPGSEIIVSTQPSWGTNKASLLLDKEYSFLSGGIPHRAVELRLEDFQNVVGNEPLDAGAPPAANNVDKSNLHELRQPNGALHDAKVNDTKEELNRIILNVHLPPAPSEAIEAPFNYISSLKSKGVRNLLIMALNTWISLDHAAIEWVVSLVADIHNTSLMLDDVQDNSPLRRSNPATHTVFGMPQTVNSSVYATVDLIHRASEQGNAQAAQEVVVGMKKLLLGQSLDLLWTFEVSTPTFEEYMQMVDGKTGALFVMIYRIMVAVSPGQTVLPALERFTLLLGRYFQIRDDYANLASPDYSKAKGFCEDLDEGKCSFIMLHALRNAQPASLTILRHLLLQRRSAGCAGLGHKEKMLAILQETGSLKFTSEMLQQLHGSLVKELKDLEQTFGVRNQLLHDVLEALRE